MPKTLTEQTVVVHDHKEREKLLEIIAHETTHLLFESYWAESNKMPPTWLNEGLAMLEEGATTGKPEKSPWYRTMAYWEDGLLTLESFFKTTPTKHMRGRDKDEEDQIFLPLF